MNSNMILTVVHS